MQKLYPVLFVLLIIPLSAFSSINSDSDTICKNKVVISPGLRSLSSIDQLYSTKKYSGSAFYIGASYIHINKNSIHKLTVSYSKIKRTPEDLSLPQYPYSLRHKELNSLLLDFNYSYMRKLNLDKIHFYVTGNFINSYNEPDESEAELVFSALAPGVYLENINRLHKFSLQVSVPVVAMALRYNYYISDPQTFEEYSDWDYVSKNTRFQFINKLFMVYTDIGYEYSFSKKFNLIAQYSFRYISDKEPRPLKSVSGIYTAGLIFKF